MFDNECYMYLSAATANNNMTLLTWQIEESEHNIPLFNDGGESFISQC